MKITYVLNVKKGEKVQKKFVFQKILVFLRFQNLLLHGRRKEGYYHR